MTNGKSPSNEIKRQYHQAQNQAIGQAKKKRRRAQMALKSKFFSAIFTIVVCVILFISVLNTLKLVKVKLVKVHCIGDFKKAEHRDRAEHRERAKTKDHTQTHPAVCVTHSVTLLWPIKMGFNHGLNYRSEGVSINNTESLAWFTNSQLA